MQSKDNVHPLNTESSAESDADVNEAIKNHADSAQSRRDFGKPALIISLLSLVLVAIFFFGLNRNLSGLTNEVRGYGELQNSVSSLDAYVDDILSQMGRINAQLLDIDAQRREVVARLLMDTMVEEMLQKTIYLRAQLAGSAEAQKLERLQAVLQELKMGGQLPVLPPATGPKSPPLSGDSAAQQAPAPQGGAAAQE